MSKVWWLWVWMAVCVPGHVQEPAAKHQAGKPASPAAQTTVVSTQAQVVLAGLAARAGVIFAGHVLDIAHNEAAGYVDVHFRVDEAVRGCSKGGVYVLREWAGLWSGEAPRYRTGQRLLLLLAARGPSGMSAPVGRNEGVIPILASAAEPLADSHGVAPAEDGSVAADITGMTADLRWVQARAMRTMSYTGQVSVQAAASTPNEPGGPGDAVNSIDRWGPSTPLIFGLGSAAATQPTVGAVLSVLRAPAVHAEGETRHEVR